MDDLRMDSHKLIFHVGRVNEWMKGKDIYPIFMDVSPTNACNHRCVFCGLDFAHPEKISFLDEKKFTAAVGTAAKRGLKSIMYAGEGEPLLHKGLSRIIKMTVKNGVDAALATNGVLMGRDFLEEALGRLTWIRVSIDAGSPKTYAYMHSCRPSDLGKVFSNLEYAVRAKKRRKLPVTIGAQFLLLKENAGEAVMLARRLQGMGIDYLSIKPYSKHPLSVNDAGSELDYSKMVPLEKKLAKFNKGRFRVIFRKHTMLKRFKPKPYKRCLCLPFWAYVSATGDVYPCHTFLGVKKFSYGNLNEASFTAIWKGARRKKIMKYFEKKMDAGLCRELCRLDEINGYLWQLKHPHPHVNFI